MHTLFDNFEKYVGRAPDPEEIVSSQQLSVLEHILTTGTCCVDLGLWGDHHWRGTKAMKSIATVPGPSGPLIAADFKGPPDIDAFARCWSNYTAGMVMLEAAPPTWLEMHCKRMKRWQTLFGDRAPRVWPFQFQCHHRYVAEHMPVAMMMRCMKRTAQLVAWDADYEPDFRNGDFDPKRPWGYLWWLATCPESPSTAEWAWWEANFDKQAQQIAYGVTADTRFVGERWR